MNHIKLKMRGFHDSYDSLKGIALEFLPIRYVKADD